MPPQLPEDLERELFSVALEFRQREPWRHLHNGHYLLVGEPEGGRRVLVVLGNGREQYGLQSYAAACAAPFLVLVEELPRTPLPSPTAVYELLDGQEVEFTAKGELDKIDLARATGCGHHPAARGRQAWPRFRSFRPGRFPWHIDETGARVLLADMRRALRWAELAPTLDWTDLDQPVARRRLPVVAVELSVNRPWTQSDLLWEQLLMPPRPAARPLLFDLAQAAALQSYPFDKGLELIVDERAPLMRIVDADGGAPYFPRVGVCLEDEAGMVVGQSVGASMQPVGMNALHALDTTLRNLRQRPRRVFFEDPILATALSPWMQTVGLPAGIIRATPALEQLWSHML